MSVTAVMVGEDGAGGGGGGKGEGKRDENLDTRCYGVLPLRARNSASTRETSSAPSRETG